MCAKTRMQESVFSAVTSLTGALAPCTPHLPLPQTPKHPLSYHAQHPHPPPCGQNNPPGSFSSFFMQRPFSLLFLSVVLVHFFMGFGFSRSCGICLLLVTSDRKDLWAEWSYRPSSLLFLSVCIDAFFSGIWFSIFSGICLLLVTSDSKDLWAEWL